MERTGLSVLISGVFGLFILFAFWIERDDFVLLFSCYSLLFGLYLLLSKKVNAFSLNRIIVLAILFRLPFLFSTPALSDDVYRFLWDGRLMLEEQNPYLYTPQDLPLELKVRIDPDQELFDSLNSASYYSVYTPFNQLIFSGVALLGAGNFQWAMFIYHLIYLLVDVIAIYFLSKVLLLLAMPRSRIAFYAFNPLLIIEATGNLHLEGFIFCFLIAAVYSAKSKLAFLWFYAAALLKLVPLVLIPLVLGSKKRAYYLLAVLAPIVVVLSFIPFSGIDGFWMSLSLYFKNFEFNASIYYLARELGFLISGYNMIHWIGPILAGVFILLAIGIAFYRRNERNLLLLLKKASLILLAYLLFSTTIHPWYIIPLLGLSLAAGFNFGIVWTYLIFLSYSHYDGADFQENYIFIALEYVLLFAFILLDLKPNLFKKIAIQG